jgi:hypothetical protein
MRKYFFLIITLLVLTSCIFEYTENGDTDADLEKIKQVFLGIFDKFTMFDVDGVMEYFSENFLNDGTDFFEERNVWYDRLGALVEITSYASIQINGDYAVVSFTIDYNGVEYSVPLDGEFTDLVYFKKFGDDWKVYGNQQDYGSTYSIDIDTNPNGASLYLNGIKLEQTSPYTMENLSEGNYIVGIYLKGYNEIWKELYLSADTTMYYYLELPSYPIPEFFIDNPQNGDIVSGDDFFLSGHVNNFTGSYAILNMNGNEQTFEVDEFGVFHQYITIYDQTNTFFLRATNSSGNTGISDDMTVFQAEDDRTLTISVFWDTDSTDVDLHVWDPEENHCYWGDLYAIPNGALMTIDDDGYGPEVFEQQPLTYGTFIVKAHFYEGYDYLNPTNATVEITLGEDTYYYGPYEFTAEGDNAGAWWEVTDFDVE